MSRLVSFRVIGDPAPQGSKVAFKAKNGQARMKETGGAKFAVWRDAVAQAAFDEAQHQGEPLDGPLILRVTFRFSMPKSRSKRLRELGRVEKSTAPDTSKLVRAVEDAMQAAGLIADDARIFHIEATKWEVWQEWTGCDITIAEHEAPL